MDWKHWQHDWCDEWSLQLVNHVVLARDVHDFVHDFLEHVATQDQIVNASLGVRRLNVY